MTTDPLPRLKASLERDTRVLGLIVGGSRGKGLGTDASDWDVYVVVADDVDPAGVRLDIDAGHPRLDLCAVLTLKAFAEHAVVGAPDEWNRYNFAHLAPSFDRTGGSLQRLCDDKEFLPPGVAAARASGLLDAYVNSYYRSLKNQRDGNADAARLDAVESVPLLLSFVFTAERRARPYNKFLAWELKVHPLRFNWWPTAEAVNGLVRLASVADAAAQAAHFRHAEAQARTLGFGGVLDSWGPLSLDAMRNGSAGG